MIKIKAKKTSGDLRFMYVRNLFINNDFTFEVTTAKDFLKFYGDETVIYQEEDSGICHILYNYPY